MIDLLPTEKPKLEDTGSDADNFQPTSISRIVQRYAILMAVSMSFCFALSFAFTAIPGRHGRLDTMTMKQRILFSVIFPPLALAWRRLLDNS